MGKGKASRWLRSLLGTKNSPSSSAEPSPPSSSSPKDKKKTSSDSKWGLIKSSLANDKSLGGGARWSHGDPSSNPHVELDANKHAIAVAAATAAVAEAALAAAQAAAEVVRLTSAATSVGGTARTVSSPPVYAGSREWRREVAAAIKIQSAFRAYLAGRALRALKGLVKLQALVRGHIVRNQSADMLRRMQAMARIQARASATRINVSESPNSKATPAPQKHDIAQHSYSAKHEGPKLKRRVSKPNISNSIKVEGLHLGSSWLDRWMEECKWNKQKDTSLKNISRDDEKSVKILEIDTWKPHYNPRQSDKTFRASQVFRAWNDNGQGVATFDAKPGIAAKHEKPNLTVSSGDVPNLRPLKFPPQEDQAWTADNSPCLHSVSSRAGCSSRKCPFTPTRSECSRSVYGDYLSHPSYMANTESSLAKVRSQSAPKQRTQYERLGMMNRKSVPGLWDVDTISEKGSTPHTNLRINAYRSSGLESRRMPVQGDAMDLSAAYHSRH